MNRRRTILLITTALFVSSFNTCGRKGDPLPPEDFHPQPPKNINVFQDYKSPVLFWNPPDKFIDGRKITKIEKKKLSYIVNINFGRKFIKIDTTVFKDKPINKGEKRCYKIAAVYKNLQGKFSEPVCIIGKEPITEIPQVQTFNATDGKVIFEFKASKNYKIEVFRSQSENFTDIKPYKVLDSQIFIDSNVKNNRSYFYKFRYAKGSLKGRYTKTFKVTPKDNIPPLPPQNVTIVKTGKTCYLIWEPSKSNDVIKYEIYFNSRKIGETENLIFEIPCKEGTYYVGAVDKAGNITLSKPVKWR